MATVRSNNTHVVPSGNIVRKDVEPDILSSTWALWWQGGQRVEHITLVQLSKANSADLANEHFLGYYSRRRHEMATSGLPTV